MTQVERDLAGLLEAHRHPMPDRRLHPADAPVGAARMADDDARLEIPWFHPPCHAGKVTAGLLRVN
jgi:hypothetical protein